jgi:zinc protease
MNNPAPTPGGQQSFRQSPPGPADLRPFRFPSFERFRLPNGLTVVHAELRSFPVLAVAAVIRAGASRDGVGRAGLAALTTALLDSGAGGRSGPEISDSLERLGLQLHVGTSWDHSQVDISGLSARARDAADLLALLVRSPDFPEQEVERLRTEHLAAVLQRRADPRALANEVIARSIYSERSPFSSPSTGSRTSLSALSRDDIVDHHRDWFHPDRGAIIVAGSVPRDDVEALLGAFTAWNGRSPDAAAANAEPRFTARTVIIVDRPGSVQSEIRVGHVGAPRSTPDYFPIIVLNTVLGGAFTSRLNLNLRERHGFTYGASSVFSMRKEPGPFLTSTAVQTDVTAAAVREIFHEIQTIREQPVTQGELQDARNYLAGVFPLTLQTASGVASRLGEIVLHELPDDYYDHYPRNILAVTREDAHRVAREYLRPDRAVVVIVGDAAAIREDIEALDLGDVQVLDPATLP